MAITGCTSAGKSTLCRALQRKFPSHIYSEIISDDDYFRNGPALDPPPTKWTWPNGKVPKCFEDNIFDSHHPDSVDQPRLVAALQAGIAKANQCSPPPKYLLVEGDSLLSHKGLLPLIDRALILDVLSERDAEVLAAREYNRSYLGKCTFEEFKVYWNQNVFPSFLKYGLPPQQMSFPYERIDSTLPGDTLVQQAAQHLGLDASAVASAQQQQQTDSSSSAEKRKRDAGEEIIICFSDIHGHISKLVDLWERLSQKLGPKLDTATLIFLGDYCDRGPNTKLVFDWLCALKAQRPAEKTIFLAGNHDFAFGAFLGCLPAAVPEGFELDTTTNPWGSESYWDQKIPEGMHFQGRRWASTIYEADSTFRSYGVVRENSLKSREDLLAAVPQAHKDFLKSLLWVHDQPISFAPYRIVCVHAGLVSDLPLQPQLEGLKGRRVEDKNLQKIWGRMDPLLGRKDVIGMHPELKDSALFVSGHHGVRKFTDNRFVLDLSGGNTYGSLEALIFSASGHEVVSSKPS